MDWENTFPNKQREKIMNHTMNELPFIVRRDPSETDHNTRMDWGNTFPNKLRERKTMKTRNIKQATQDIKDWKQSPSGLRWNWFLKEIQDGKKDLNTIPFPHATKIEYRVFNSFLEGNTRMPDMRYAYLESVGKIVKDPNGEMFGYVKEIEKNSSYLDLMFQIEELMSQVDDWQHCCVSSSFEYKKDTQTIDVFLNS